MSLYETIIRKDPVASTGCATQILSSPSATSFDLRLVNLIVIIGSATGSPFTKLVPFTVVPIAVPFPTFVMTILHSLEFRLGRRGSHLNRGRI
jgi:hypothetical protein